MMKRQGEGTAMRGHFRQNGNPESPPVSPPPAEARGWRMTIKEEVQTVFRAALGGAAKLGSAWYFY